MKKIEKLLRSILLGKFSAIVFAIISAIDVIVYYSYRVGFVYVDEALFKNFSMILFILSIFATAFLTAVIALRLKNSPACDKKAMHAFQIISEIYSIIILVFNIVNIIVGKSQSFTAAVGLFKEAFPLWLGCICLTSALFIIPNVTAKGLKKAISVIVTAVMLFTVYASVFPVVPFEFKAQPAVFDNGSGYSVVFATTDKATAYIEYDYNGEHIKKYDENNGRKLGYSKIHSITVPYEELSGNSYKVGATRVIDELSYGGRLGKTIESKSITLNDKLGDNINLLTISDWHTYNKRAKKTISYLGKYNAVALLGDSAPGIMLEDDVVNYLVTFAGELTDGTMPVIFVRGNHETRGEMASKLSGFLKMDKFYYKTSLGNYDFIVLDSGEDKEDSHPEYGSMADYSANRKEMIKWLDSLQNKDGKKTIALSHAKEICIEKDLSENAYNKLNDLGVSFLACGHEHIFKFINSSPFPILIDGGIDANGAGTYVASMLKISPDGIGVTSVDSNNKTVIDKKVSWK